MLSCFRNALSKKKDSNGKQKKKEGGTYECNGCQQTGFGPYYWCINVGCNLHYHQHCGDLLRSDISWAVPVSNHPPYPTGHLILKATAPRKVRCCVACGDHVLGLRYKAWHKKAHGSYNPFWLFRQQLSNRACHPLCTLLPKQIRGTGNQEIDLKLEEGMRGECPVCKGDAKGWAYNSTCRIYGYPVGCVKKKIIQSWQQEEAPGTGWKKRKVTIYVKKALRPTLEIAKWAFQQIIQVLFGLPAAMVVDIIVKLFDFTYENILELDFNCGGKIDFQVVRWAFVGLNHRVIQQGKPRPEASTRGSEPVKPSKMVAAPLDNVFISGSILGSAVLLTHVYLFFANMWRHESIRSRKKRWTVIGLNKIGVEIKKVKRSNSNNDRGSRPGEKKC
ncbi:hypothetical protein NL676_037152 [Syzygium grande]|nr:hypothetical protein NL676_037152 [Syzygium grande]